MSTSSTAMAGDPPWPWYPYHPLTDTPWWPTSWDAPSEPKVQEVALVGHEDYIVVGVFVYVWDARRAAARALRAYRNYWRTADFDEVSWRPRGNDLRAQITSRKVNQYIAQWWDKP